MKRKEGIHRHDISDEAWERIKELLPGQAGKRGRVAKDNRLVYQRGSVADAYRRSVEGYTAGIRELEQHTQAVLPLAG
jgi:transposase